MLRRRYTMVFYGLEKDRGTLKYRCRCAVYGIGCREWEICSSSDNGRMVRVPLDWDRPRFVPVPRSTYKWKGFYRGRTAVERVNSRLDVSFGFERHFIGGIKKMPLGSIEMGRPDPMRSLVWNRSLRRAA